MAIYYSPGSGGFYDSAINPAIPADAVPVTLSAYQALMAAQAAGQVIVPGSGGAPVATAPAPVTLTLAQQAQVQLAQGFAVTCTSTPALSGTYSVADINSRINVISQMVSIATTGNFSNGSTTIAWIDMSGTPHTFGVAQFRELAIAIGAYFTTMEMIILTDSGTIPPATATIA